MKGIAGAYGYQPITDVAGKIEGGLRQDDSSELETLMTDLVNLCQYAPQQFAAKYNKQRRTA